MFNLILILSGDAREREQRKRARGREQRGQREEEERVEKENTVIEGCLTFKQNQIVYQQIIFIFYIIFVLLTQKIHKLIVLNVSNCRELE